MEDLKSYIIEGIFDEDDIMDNIDKDVEITKWFKELNDSSSYIKGFDHLWVEIAQHNKEIRASQVASLDGLFFVVEKYRPYDDDYRFATEYNEDQWRLRIFWKHGGGNLYAFYQVIGFVYKNQILKLKANNGAWGLKNVIQRKSRTNNVYARQIYHLSSDYKWVYKLMEMLYDKLK